MLRKAPLVFKRCLSPSALFFAWAVLLWLRTSPGPLSLYHVIALRIFHLSYAGIAATPLPAGGGPSPKDRPSPFIITYDTVSLAASRNLK